jgi:DegV family protein with EDD domain
MKEDFAEALRRGAERVFAWASILDDINVFPVADGDTGRNLTISLQPLKRTDRDIDTLKRDLLLSARGNSGNISARFFTSFIEGRDWQRLTPAVKRGRDLAYQAVANPEAGTMLSLLDSLVRALEAQPPRPEARWKVNLLEQLAADVKKTVTQQPLLRNAGVVDAGALGLYFFFEAFFDRLIESSAKEETIVNRFGDLIRLNPSWQAPEEARICVDATIKLHDASTNVAQEVSALGEELVTIIQGDLVKVHLHTDDESRFRERLSSLATVVDWKSDDMRAQTAEFRAARPRQALHIVTDAAGSVTAQDARELGITVLDSYIQIEDRSMSESHLIPSELYKAMREGKPVTTSQASLFERYQHYQRLLSFYPQVLYLCVGSAFTGIYNAAMEWKRANDTDDRLMMIDTGAAAGRLGLVALATARVSRDATGTQEVIDYAKNALDSCKEYIFLDRLHYLAAGGRIFRASALFGDILRMKPVISPLPEGATKVGVVRNRDQQVEFALERISNELDSEQPAIIMLEFSDNLSWVERVVQPLIIERFPSADILLRPLSRTSGAHMGPGTWALAFLQTAVASNRG